MVAADGVVIPSGDRGPSGVLIPGAVNAGRTRPARRQSPRGASSRRIAGSTRPARRPAAGTPVLSMEEGGWVCRGAGRGSGEPQAVAPPQRGRRVLPNQQDVPCDRVDDRCGCWHAWIRAAARTTRRRSPARNSPDLVPANRPDGRCHSSGERGTVERGPQVARQTRGTMRRHPAGQAQPPYRSRSPPDRT
jgi:hypothetical protein